MGGLQGGHAPAGATRSDRSGPRRDESPPAGEEMIAKGKALYEGKALCKVCHGPDGEGFGKDIAPGSLKGPLPRNFTDKKWQAARTDGELFWIEER